MGAGAPVLTGGVGPRALHREGRGRGPSLLPSGRVLPAVAVAFLKMDTDGGYTAAAAENGGTRKAATAARAAERAQAACMYSRPNAFGLHLVGPTLSSTSTFRQGSARSAVSPSVSPMVKNNYSSGRNDDRIANPNGKNETQDFVPEGEEGPHEKDVLPCHSYSAVGNMNMNSMLVENIRSHDYFKGLSEMKTFEEVVDQIYYDCKIVPLWTPGTHKAQKAAGMCSGLRGVRRAPARPAVPSALPAPLVPIASQPEPARARSASQPASTLRPFG